MFYLYFSHHIIFSLALILYYKYNVIVLDKKYSDEQVFGIALSIILLFIGGLPLWILSALVVWLCYFIPKKIDDLFLNIKNNRLAKQDASDANKKAEYR